MGHIRAAEAERSLSALLDLVEAGEDVTIARNGRPVARLIAAGNPDRVKSMAAVQRVMELRKGVTLAGVATPRELIGEGRR